MFDVAVTRAIDAPPDRVAAILFDPARDLEWMGGVSRSEVLSPPPYRIGGKVRRTGAFLGRTISWITETVAFEPARLARLRILEGPFVGEVVYELKAADGRTLISLRNRGSMRGMPDFISRLVVGASTKADLKRLAALAESAAPAAR